MCNLTKQMFYRGQPHVALGNGLERRKIMFHIMILKNRVLDEIWKSTCHLWGKQWLTGSSKKKKYKAIKVWS